MDAAIIRDASNGRILSTKPLMFFRLPERGELVLNRQSLWTVVRVIHGWSQNDVPIAWVDVSPTSTKNPNTSDFNAFSESESEA